MLQTTEGTDVNPSSPGATGNKLTDVSSVKDPYSVTVDVIASRTFPAFREAAVVAEILPPNLLGDYHLTGTGSPAYGAGIAATTVSWGTGSGAWSYPVSAPADDSEGDPRPSGSPPRYDAGSDQLSP